MISRVLAGLLVAGCVTAAAGGAYLAMRQNGAAQPAPVSPAAAAQAQPAQPVSETEAVVDGTSPATLERPAPAPDPAKSARPDPVRPEEPRASGAVTRSAPVRDTTVTRRPSAQTANSQPRPAAPQVPAAVAPPVDRGGPETPNPAPPNEPAQEPVRVPEPPPQAQFEEAVLPASSVVGLQVDTSLSTERARLEDRVDARVSRDVTAAGRLAIPAGSRVIGSVTLVERGGKMKERARLGVRFHTLVLADGREIPLRTEAIFREGDSPANESARKIGGAAIGGAILGAIIGGGKGAVMGGAAGAAGGSAAVMAGDRNAATLPAGTIVTVRLTAPATIEIEKEQ